ncbi:hypothetical protein TREES_T100001054 [Tupaia chinensis]|uniref:Uncharacterized protein n=1 Tax=Tupaia chinensis TaxID=246437 RepID=L9JBU0_TUPCH|nr:hypothetical protein TREES_T100001054 [Tupaia chinensis]
MAKSLRLQLESPLPMAQAATPGDSRLLCSSKQALALYQHLFRCPAGLGQLQAALQQVQEGRGCPPGLELPTVLLEMERSRQAQEQLLWDLELLTGAGLGLFWPPWAHFCSLRDQAQHAGSQSHQCHGSTGEDPGQPDLAQREEGSQAGPTTQRPLLPPSRSPQGKMTTQETLGLQAPQDPPKGLGSILDQERTELQRTLRMDTPQSQRGEDSLGQRGEAPQSERLKSQKGAPQSQRGNGLKCQREGTPWGQETDLVQSSEGSISQAWEVALGEAVVQSPKEGDPPGYPRDFCRPLREQSTQPGGRESPGSRGRTTQLMQDEDQRETTLAVAKPGPAGKAAWAPLPAPAPRSATGRRLPGLGAVMPEALSPQRSVQRAPRADLPGTPQLAHYPQGLQNPGGGPGPAEQEVGEARPPGVLGERKGVPQDPRPSNDAWPSPAGRGKAVLGVSVAQLETALQQLLELHGAARRRRRRDREQQRLRVRPRGGWPGRGLAAVS